MGACAAADALNTDISTPVSENARAVSIHHAPVGMTSSESEDETICRLKFTFGRLLTTVGALEAFQRTGDNLTQYLRRHLSGDWGDLDEHDRLENERSLLNGFRLLSAYHLSDGSKIWLITEADRSCTTFLLPDEY